jgi:NADH-quinone oxidoreductase subunit G
MIVGSNPRREAPVLNARIRKRWRRGQLPIGLVGERADLTYPYEYLGSSGETLARVVAGDGDFAASLKAASRPIVLVGQGALAGPAGGEVLATAAALVRDLGAARQDWNGLAVLHTAAARVGALDIGFVPGEGGLAARDMVAAADDGRVDVLFLLGADEIDLPAAGRGFVVYLGTHGDAGAARADVVLPGAAYTEKAGTFVNTEGRVQLANRAVFPPGDSREDWAILRALSAVLGRPLPFDSFGELRARLHAAYPHMAAADTITPGSVEDVARLGGRAAGKLGAGSFVSPIRDFYLTNPIARASRVLAECSALQLGPVAEAAE